MEQKPQLSTPSKPSYKTNLMIIKLFSFLSDIQNSAEMQKIVM